MVRGPWTRRRARLASILVASAERPTIGAISANGTANMSWSTKASRSAGASSSSTTSMASPTRVGQQRLVFRVGGRVGRSRPGPGRARSSGLLPPCPAGAELVEADPRDHRRQPAAEVVDVVVSVRLSRSHPSWTASSASLTEPSIR